MKLTRDRLKQIIKEELEEIMATEQQTSSDVEMLKSILNREGLIGKTFEAQKHHLGAEQTAADILSAALLGVFQQFNGTKIKKGEPQVEASEFNAILNQAVKIVTDDQRMGEINFKIGNPPFKPSIPSAKFTIQAK
jgi:hypothetical protein